MAPTPSWRWWRCSLDEDRGATHHLAGDTDPRDSMYGVRACVFRADGAKNTCADAVHGITRVSITIQVKGRAAVLIEAAPPPPPARRRRHPDQSEGRQSERPCQP